MPNPPDILLGSLIGDALALGPHWIYNPREIHENFGRVTIYRRPPSPTAIPP